MFCTTCGKKISDDAMFCGYCGTSVYMQQREDVQPPQQVSQSAPQLAPQPSQPMQQPVQSQPVRYVAHPVNAPVPSATVAPKKKNGWIVAVSLGSVFGVLALGYLLYLSMTSFLRFVMDTAYEDQNYNREWNSSDYDTERPWDLPQFSQEEPETDNEAEGAGETELPDRDGEPNGDVEDDRQIRPYQEDGNDQQDRPYRDDNNDSQDNYDYNLGDDVYAYDGAGIGYVGDIIHTYWFDFTVKNVLFCPTFQGYTARDGYQLMVLELTMENTFHDEVPMFDTDYWVEWGDDDYDFDYAFPITDAQSLSQDFLPEKYYLPYDGNITGLLMYEVPVRYSEYMLIFEEYFEDGDVGDWFGVYIYSDAAPNVHTL